MKYRLKFQHTFEKEAKRLGKRYMSMKSDIASLSEELLANPHLGTDLGGGLRRIRMAITSKGKGKSGGARVISFTVVVVVEEGEINWHYMYVEGERSEISKKEIEALRRLNGLK